MQQQPQPTQGQLTQQPGASTGQMTQPGSGGQSGQGQLGQQPGQQMVQGGEMGQGQMGLALQDVETPEQRAAVDNISRAIQVCGWCADQCIQSADPNMIECIRLCEDVTELGETALALIPRGSRFTPSILRAFEQAAQACAQECGQHAHSHCQECAQILPQAAQSVQQLQAAFGQQQSGF